MSGFESGISLPFHHVFLLLGGGGISHLDCLVGAEVAQQCSMHNIAGIGCCAVADQ